MTGKVAGHTGLGKEAAEHYRKQGYWLYRQPVFTEAKFGALCGIFEELLAAKGELRADELDVPHFRDERLLEFLLDDHVLDLVETFIGPNIGLWSSHFICKEPMTGRATPWHTDADYWHGRFDREDQIVTLWLAIDGVDRENGCMKVIPGTHLEAAHEYVEVDSSQNTFASEIRPDQVDMSKAVYFELEAGHCSFHDARIVHGAEANTSPRRRAGYTMRYFSQSMKLEAENPRNKEHRLWHCRGENVAGNPVVNG